MPSSSSSSSSSSGDASRYIVLTKGQISEYVEGRTQGYKIRLEVTEAHNVTEDIFVFQRRANPVAGGDPIDEFTNVASPNDINEYAADAPSAGENKYRLSVVELVFRNLDLLEQTVADIESDIAELIRTLNQLDVLVDETVVIVSDLPPESASVCDSAAEETSSCSSSSSWPVRRSISLHIHEPSVYTDGRTQGYRLNLTITEAVGLTTSLFTFQRKIGADSDRFDEFSNVASPSDIEEYPEGAPDEPAPPGELFYRLDEVSLVFRDLDLLYQSLQDIRQDLCALIESLWQMDQLQEQTVVIDENCVQQGADPCPFPPITARLIGDTRDPAVTDDAISGYGNGSIWTNLTTRITYVLINNTNGSALWIPIAGAAVKNNFTATTDPTWC
jgi:hypothetical protein